LGRRQRRRRRNLQKGTKETKRKAERVRVRRKRGENRGLREDGKVYPGGYLNLEMGLKRLNSL